MEKEKTKSIIVKIGCALLAFTLWLYITKTENPNITYNVRNIDVRLTNTDVLAQKNLCLENTDGYTVDIKVEGKASDPKVTKNDFDLYVDLYEYALKDGINKLPIKVEASPNNVNILNNGIPWLQVNIDTLVEATVPVKINVVEKEKTDKFLKEVITDPKEIKIYGPSRKVKQVKYALGEFDVSKSNELKSAVIEVKPVNALSELVKDVTLDTNVVNVALGVNTIKSLPIKVNIKGDSPATFKISKTEVNPSIIKLMGDEKIINKLQYIETNPIDVSNTNETKVFKKVKIILPQGVETLDSTIYVDVTVVIEAENVVREIESKIIMENTGPGLIASLDKEDIKYKVSGINPNIDNLNKEQIKVYVDLKGLDVGTHSVNVNITPPSGITLVNKEPKVVSVKITKKAGV